MSTSSTAGGPPPVPAARRADPSLERGARIAQRFEIVERLGQSEAAISFLAKDLQDPTAEGVSLKIVDAAFLDLFREFEPTFALAHAADHKSLSKLIAWGSAEPHPYIALEYVRGQTLRHAIEKKQEARARFMPRTALSLITPVCHALMAAHERLPHGALTPQNIYVERNGRVRLANLGFGWFTEKALRPRGLGATSDSAFIAPEMRRDSSAATPLADIFGLGMITICLLAGHHPSREAADDLAHKLLEDVPPGLRDLLGAAIAHSPGERPATVNVFFTRLHEGIEELRDQIIHAARVATAEHEPPSAEAPSEAPPGQLSQLLGSDELPAVPESGEDPAVWLVHRDGFDYGPYSSEQVREQLLQDALDEFTEIRNLETQERALLGEVDEFSEFVEDYVPVRDERRKREAERREEVQRKVKRAGATGIITILVGLLGLAGLYFYYVEFVRAKPEPLALESLFARVGSDFRAPDQAYVGIAADPDLMAALFNFEEEMEEAPRRTRRRNAEVSAEGSDGGIMPEDLVEEDSTIDFSATGGGNRRLTSSQINDTILEEGRAIQSCLRSEVSRNPRFSSTEMRFVVRPDGRTQGVGLGGGNYTEQLSGCLVPIFRRMRFPEHDGLNLPVSFPFNVRAR